MYVGDFDFIWANSFLRKVFVVFGEGGQFFHGVQNPW